MNILSCFKLKRKLVGRDHSNDSERNPPNLDGSDAVEGNHSASEDPSASDDPDVAERDPSGRYVRSNEILGRGEWKIVYKAFDEVDGIEVAWNQVRVDDQKLVHSPEYLVRLYSEVSLLKSLNHENVIKCYCSWVHIDADQSVTVNVITELFTSGDLRRYRSKHRNVDLKAIKNWARQVLRGLHYLHSHNPPIIHRDLQGDNIFINGNNGRVKIGDLGLAVVLRDQPTANCSFIGALEFMAPELYKEEEYNQLVDIYSFGICMLEIATCEYPYSECESQAQVYSQVTSGRKPASLGKITDPQVKQFIEKCLAPVSIRSSAVELLNDPFLTPNTPELTQSASLSSSMINREDELACLCDDKSISKAPGLATLKLSRFSEKGLSFTLLGKKEHSDNIISMNVQIAGHSSHAKSFDFIFNLQTDTSASIAQEMVDELELPNEDAVLIADLTVELVRKLNNNCDSINSPCPTLEACEGSNAGFSDSLPLDDVDDQTGLCEELKMELAAIDAMYLQLKEQLMKMRAEDIENAKRKWSERNCHLS